MTRKREAEIRALLLAELLATKRTIVKMKKLLDSLMTEARKR